MDKNRRFLRRELILLELIARINACLGMRYVVLSQYLLEVVRGHGASKPVHVVPIYGVDTKLFHPTMESKSAIKIRCGLPVTGSIIFFSSRVAPEKDAETLLAAVRLLMDAGRDLWLLHRSGGYETLIKWARIFGIEERVIATAAVHPQKGLVDDYRASDLCVQASREEGLGFSVLEAMACGVPVIATDIGGLRETVLQGSTGWRYPVGDSISLADCIAAVIDDPVEAKRRGAEGRKMVCQRFNRELVFSQLEDILRGTNEEVSSI